MPLYEYQCDACGHRFEKIQKFSDPVVDTCPICGGAVRKLMSSPAIQFKGSGFYITDYVKKDKGGEKTDSGSAKSESSAGKGKDDTSGKSEKSAPAASSEKAAGTSSTASTSSDSTSGGTKAKS